MSKKMQSLDNAVELACLNLDEIQAKLKNASKEMEETLSKLGLRKQDFNNALHQKLIKTSSILTKLNVDDVEPSSLLLKSAFDHSESVKDQQLTEDIKNLSTQIQNGFESIDKWHTRLSMDIEYNQMVINNFKKEYNVNEMRESKAEISENVNYTPPDNWRQELMNEIIKSTEELNELGKRRNVLQEELSAYDGLPPNLEEMQKLINSCVEEENVKSEEYSKTKRIFQKKP